MIFLCGEVKIRILFRENSRPNTGQSSLNKLSYILSVYTVSTELECHELDYDRLMVWFRPYHGSVFCFMCYTV